MNSNLDGLTTEEVEWLRNEDCKNMWWLMRWDTIHNKIPLRGMWHQRPNISMIQVVGGEER